MKKSIMLMAGVCLNIWCMQTHAESKWSYQGDGAPEHWANINQDYNRCSGFNQSPINVTNTIQADIAPLKFDYHATAQTIINNGHTIQINFTDGGDLHLDGDIFYLKQFHLHTPSENKIEGTSYPLEAHFVHMNKQGALAVVGVMYAEGLQNLSLAKLWNQLPKEINTEIKLNQDIQAADFLPKQQQYYRFNGSLTTPPCTEGVRWILFKDIQTASTEQIKSFAALMEHGNSRPIQPVNARIILSSP